MSQTKPTTDRAAELRREIQTTFEPYLKSEQCRDLDHTDFPHQRRHHDGDHIRKTFAIKSLVDNLIRFEGMDHPNAKYVEPLAHFLTHIEPIELNELRTDTPDFKGRLDRKGMRPRKELFEWYRGFDKDAAEEQHDAAMKRLDGLTDGGTGAILHGEQGTGKTSVMYWFVAHIMSTNPSENVIWQATLDDAEWKIFAPWATICLPEGVDVVIEANPNTFEYADVGQVELDALDVARDVITYSSHEDLVETIADRTPGQFYTVYPDPYFRGCQAVTGWEYESMWEVDESHEATNLNHNWFALMMAIKNSAVYNDWTTLVADEAHKWLQQGASDDEHQWHKKIRDWATYWGDARKERLSCILAVHKWHELDYRVRDKVRWGVTMEGEVFPKHAPKSIAGSQNRGSGQSIGAFAIWNTKQWNFTGTGKDVKQKLSIPADIEVTYPELEAETHAKS